MLSGIVNITNKPDTIYENNEMKKYEMSPTFSIINEKTAFMDKRLLRKKMNNKNNRRYAHNELMFRHNLLNNKLIKPNSPTNGTR